MDAPSCFLPSPRNKLSLSGQRGTNCSYLPSWVWVPSCFLTHVPLCHADLPALLPTHLSHSCLRAFAPALFSETPLTPRHPGLCLAPSWSPFRSRLTCHLLREACPDQASYNVSSKWAAQLFSNPVVLNLGCLLEWPVELLEKKKKSFNARPYVDQLTKHLWVWVLSAGILKKCPHLL